MGVIARRLAIVEEQVNKLQELAKLDYESFKRDEDARMVAERRLHMSIEALIDVGLRIVSLIGLEKPERYRDLAGVMVKKGVIPGRLRNRLRENDLFPKRPRSPVRRVRSRESL